MHKLCAVCFAALLVLAPSAGHAAGIVLKNSMNTDIKSVFFIGNNNERLSAVEGLPKRGTKTAAAAKFPEHSCSRIGVTMQNGAGWQYYHEPEPGSAKEIEFTLESAGQHETRKYPSVLITLPDNDAYGPSPCLCWCSCARFDQPRWKDFAYPGYEALKDPGAFAVCFADQSWSLAQGGSEVCWQGRNA